MNFRKRFDGQSPGFQMAPLIDIMFLLLIFYMVASVFQQWETKIGITVPTAQTGVEATRTPVELLINIDSEGRFYINEFEVSPARLEQILQRISSFEGHPVIIRADENTPHKWIIKVLDMCRKVDIWNVSFATLPPDEKTPAPAP